MQSEDKVDRFLEKEIKEHERDSIYWRQELAGLSDREKYRKQFLTMLLNLCNLSKEMLISLRDRRNEAAEIVRLICESDMHKQDILHFFKVVIFRLFDSSLLCELTIANFINSKLELIIKKPENYPKDEDS